MSCFAGMVIKVENHSSTILVSLTYSNSFWPNAILKVLFLNAPMTLDTKWEACEWREVLLKITQKKESYLKTVQQEGMALLRTNHNCQIQTLLCFIIFVTSQKLYILYLRTNVQSSFLILPPVPISNFHFYSFPLRKVPFQACSLHLLMYISGFLVVT